MISSLYYTQMGLNSCYRRCTPADAWCVLPANYSIAGAVPIVSDVICDRVPLAAKLWTGIQVAPGYWQLASPDHGLCMTGNVADVLINANADSSSGGQLSQCPQHCEDISFHNDIMPILSAFCLSSPTTAALTYRLVASPCASLGPDSPKNHSQLFTFHSHQPDDTWVPGSHYVQSVLPDPNGSSTSSCLGVVGQAQSSGALYPLGKGFDAVLAYCWVGLNFHHADAGNYIGMLQQGDYDPCFVTLRGLPMLPISKLIEHLL